MRKITDSSAVFSVTINPFLREIRIEHIESGDTCTYTWTSSLEKWKQFKNHHFHFLYTSVLDFEIYGDGFSNVAYNLDINGI